MIIDFRKRFLESILLCAFLALGGRVGGLNDYDVTYLRVYDLPAALHQFRLLEEPRLAEQQTRVLRRQTSFEKVNTGAGQMGHDVLLRHVEGGEHVVGLQEDLITVHVAQEREEGRRLDVRHANLLLVLRQPTVEHGIEHGTARG